jgi:hypothetical protein
MTHFYVKKSRSRRSRPTAARRGPFLRHLRAEMLEDRRMLAITPVQVAKLLAGDAAADDRFGFSVAVAGDTAVIGAHRDDDGGTNSGSVYVLRAPGQPGISRPS